MLLWKVLESSDVPYQEISWLRVKEAVLDGHAVSKASRAAQELSRCFSRTSLHPQMWRLGARGTSHHTAGRAHGRRGRGPGLLCSRPGCALQSLLPPTPRFPVAAWRCVRQACARPDRRAAACTRGFVFH